MRKLVFFDINCVSGVLDKFEIWPSCNAFGPIFYDLRVDPNCGLFSYAILFIFIKEFTRYQVFWTYTNVVGSMLAICAPCLEFNRTAYSPAGLYVEECYVVHKLGKNNGPAPSMIRLQSMRGRFIMLTAWHGNASALLTALCVTSL